jgi:hypothetical protein
MINIYRILLAVLLLAGGGLYAGSFRYDWYKVPQQELHNLAQRLADKPRDVRWREWYEGRKELETPRKALHDCGVGLVALAVTLAALHLLSGFPLKNCRTPKRKWSFIGIYLSAIALQVPASVYYLAQRQARGDYPWWGDSIGIGLFQTVFGCIAFGVVGSLLFLAILWKTVLPAQLYGWPKGHLAANTVISILCGLPTILCLCMLPDPVRDGSIGGVLMTTVLIYLFLSARAGMVEYHQTTKALREPPPAN